MESDSVVSHLFTPYCYQSYLRNLGFNPNMSLYLYQFTLTHQGYETLILTYPLFNSYTTIGL